MSHADMLFRQGWRPGSKDAPRPHKSPEHLHKKERLSRASLLSPFEHSLAPFPRYEGEGCYSSGNPARKAGRPRFRKIRSVVAIRLSESKRRMYEERASQQGEVLSVDTSSTSKDEFK